MSLKVYLQYPWKFPDSPYYKSLIENPSEGIEYLNIEKQKGVITNKRFFWLSNFLKRNIRKLLYNLGTSVPNAHLSPEGDYDLIHCAHCLSKNENKPWIADFEASWQFYVGKENKKTKEKILQILLKENCKKLLAWTEETRREILKDFPEIEDKLEVVYPAIPEKKFKKEKKKEINLIFSGRYFFWKGGLHALEAIDQLTKKYENVYGIINSEVPEEIRKRYSANRKISFYGLLPQDKLFELYKKSDIMIYPGYSDSFGFGFLEAMSFGIPVVTIDGFAREELITQGKTGFVISRPMLTSQEMERLIRSDSTGIIKEIIEAGSEIITNNKLRDRMSNNCLKTIKEGKFSINKRNKIIKEICQNSLK
jgi:glycosyltransferase involved in cell wall biosynthesis